MFPRCILLLIIGYVDVAMPHMCLCTLAPRASGSWSEFSGLDCNRCRHRMLSSGLAPGALEDLTSMVAWWQARGSAGGRLQVNLKDIIDWPTAGRDRFPATL